MGDPDEATDGNEPEIEDAEWAILASSDSSTLRYLASPPESPPPVVTTNVQVLPLGALAWSNFERLCYRLCRRKGDVEDCLFYGIPGQAQHGIDIFMWHKEAGFSAVQCKQYRQFTSNNLKKAVQKFLDGPWKGRAKTFVLATSTDLAAIAEDIREQVGRLKDLGIGFQVWDLSSLSDQLKAYPDLVLDFFGRAGVEAFLGPDAIEHLDGRLEPSELINYRRSLGELYREVVAVDDPGIVVGSSSTPLRQRFVIPDLLVESDIHSQKVRSDGATNRHRDVSDMEEGVIGAIDHEAEGNTPSSIEARVALDAWLGTGDRKLVLGEPGAGKSALLRYLLLDMFEDEPTLEAVASRWGDAVPVWIPFGFWTRLVRKAAGPIGLEECIHRWLAFWSRDDLWPLLQRSIEDQRLVLIVDGFDEWATEPLGAQTVRQLVVFAKSRNCAVIASSRPFGAEALALAPSTWDIARVAPLSDEQRYEVVDRWLESWWSRHAATPRETMPETLIAEIDASERIRQLSRNPLMLSIVLYLRALKDELPSNSIAVLDQIVNHLIDGHRRQKLYSAASAADMVRPDEIRRLAVLVAAELQRKGLDALPYPEALDLMRRTLSDDRDKLGLAYSEADSSALARSLLDSVSADLGLFVQPRDGSVGFIHRFIQEYLCAEHMLLCSRDTRRALILDRFRDPQWRECITLCLQQVQSEEEVRALFRDLDGEDPIFGEIVDHLAAAVTFSDANNIGGEFRVSLALRVIQRIETGERPGHRVQLIGHIPGGLRSPSRGLLLRKIQDWLCGTRKHPVVNDYAALAAWPIDELTEETLWRGVLSDDRSTQRACAVVLGDNFHGADNALSGRLVELACRTNVVGRRAAAIEALGRGWPDVAELDQLVSDAIDSNSPELVGAGLGADLTRGNKSERTRDLLLELGEIDHHGFVWPATAGHYLATFFADDDVVLERYLAAVRSPEGRTSVGTPPAVYVLLQAFSANPRVREWVIREIREANYPFIIMGAWPWQMVANAYSDDPEVVDAVAEWAARHTSGAHDVQLSSAAQVGRSDRLRSRLLHDLSTSSLPSWAASALLATYRDDSEVMQALRVQALDVDLTRTEQLAELIPDIVTPLEARDRLLALAVDPEVKRLDRVVAGLASLHRERGSTDIDLGVESTVDRIVTRLLAAYSQGKRPSADNALYAHFGWVVSVRALALRRLDEPDLPLEALAYGFKDDLEVRRALIPRLFPLPTMLRARLTQVLTDVPLSDNEITQTLDSFDSDADEAVKILGAVAVATRARRRKVGIEDLISRFVDMVRSVGQGSDERRSAGLAGLATLHEIGRLVDLREEFRPDHLVTVQAPLVDRSGAFDRVLASNWTEIREALGEEAESRLSRYGARSLWRRLLGVAADYAPLRAEALRRVDTDPAIPQRTDPDSWDEAAAEARFLARVEPGSDRLRARCLALVEGGIGFSYAETLPYWLSVEILAAQFLDDPVIKDWLETHLSETYAHLEDLRTYAPHPVWMHLDPVVLAACRLRPKDPRLRQLASLVDLSQGLTTGDVEVLFAVSGPDDFVELVDRVCERLAWSGWFADLVYRPARARLSADDDLVVALKARLAVSSDRSQGTLVRLLAAAGNSFSDPKYTEERRIHLWHCSPRILSYDPLIGEVRGEDLIWRDLAI